MQYYAHKTDSSKLQTIYEHLHNVADFAQSFSIDICKDVVKSISLMHDIGKYSVAFQNRLNGSNVKFEHSTCGALEYETLISNSKDEFIVRMMQYCVIGHHTGLPDGGSKVDIEDDVTLNSRLKRKNRYVGQSDYSTYVEYIKPFMPKYDELLNIISNSSDKNELIEKYAFFVRYIFSCLVDADFLDTEKFCNPNINRRLKSDFIKSKEIIDKKFKTFTQDTELKMARTRLQNQAFVNASTSSQISILNMPTGSGKTLCSLKIAFEKLISKNKKRIIYVIPYTSIIEQTAELFNCLFGNHIDILQHHSNYCFDDFEGDDTQKKLKMATENWDSPFIITTSVQFFESLYHYKGSRLRKLHNLADSVIVFDEIHMMPIEMLQPCLRSIGYIAKYLNSEIILLSATMPNYSDLFRKYLPSVSPTELINDRSDFDYFQKCRFINLGKTDYATISAKTDDYNSSLIIVNSRKSAKEMYKIINGNKYHLSTYMTPFDRSRVINNIKKDLKNGQKVTVVSTSLVEAGVDFDFQAVFRELAGLDNIIQSAGRCNREGKLEKGDVFIFETDEKPMRELAIRANITGGIINEYENITDNNCIIDYYNRLFKFNEKTIDMNTIATNVNGFDNIPFRSYAESFNYIKDDTIAVVIDKYSETKELLHRLKNGDYSVKRKLQKYCVSLKRQSEFNICLEQGVLYEVNGIFVLSDAESYSYELGIDLDRANNDIII